MNNYMNLLEYKFISGYMISNMTSWIFEFKVPVLNYIVMNSYKCEEY